MTPKRQKYIEFITNLSLLDHHKLKLHLPSDKSDCFLQRSTQKNDGLEFQIGVHKKKPGVFLIFPVFLNSGVCGFIKQLIKK